MGTSALAASVEDGHRFVGGTCLKLHEVGAWMGTKRAVYVRGVLVFQDGVVLHSVSELLTFVIGAEGNLATGIIVDVRTRRTRKMYGIVIRLGLEQIRANRAKT